MSGLLALFRRGMVLGRNSSARGGLGEGGKGDCDWGTAPVVRSELEME